MTCIQRSVLDCCLTYLFKYLSTNISISCNKTHFLIVGLVKNGWWPGVFISGACLYFPKWLSPVASWSLNLYKSRQHKIERRDLSSRNAHASRSQYCMVCITPFSLKCDSELQELSFSNRNFAKSDCTLEVSKEVGPLHSGKAQKAVKREANALKVSPNDVFVSQL